MASTVVLKTGLLCLTLRQYLGLVGQVRLQPYFSRILKALTSPRRESKTWCRDQDGREGYIYCVLFCLNTCSAVVQSPPIGKETLPLVCCGLLCSPSAWSRRKSADTCLTEADRCWPTSGHQLSHPGLNLRRRGVTGLFSWPRPSGQREGCCSFLWE